MLLANCWAIDGFSGMFCFLGTLKLKVLNINSFVQAEAPLSQVQIQEPRSGLLLLQLWQWY